MPPIIAFAPNNWMGSPKNRQQLLSRLALRGWPVIYSTGALFAWQRHDPEWRMASLLGAFSRDPSGVSIDSPGRALARWPRFAIWDHLAARTHARRLIAQAGPEWRTNGIAFLFHPSFVPYLDLLEPRHVVFHAYDAYALMDSNWSQECDRQLSMLAQRADILSATTDGVIATFPPEARSKARLLENGADVEAFRNARSLPCPAALANIPHPRIGYMGTVNRRMDFDAINRVAKSHPDWHWVLVGEVIEKTLTADEGTRSGYQESRELKNIHYLEPVPSHDVPAYVGHMDVNTICYRMREDEWVSAGYPVKLHEYLAAGLPVVSAPLDVIRQKFSSVVALAGTPKEWEAAIQSALRSEAPGSAESRQTVAAQNSWDERAQQLDRWLREMVAAG